MPVASLSPKIVLPLTSLQPNDMDTEISNFSPGHLNYFSLYSAFSPHFTTWFHLPTISLPTFVLPSNLSPTLPLYSMYWQSLLSCQMQGLDTHFFPPQMALGTSELFQRSHLSRVRWCESTPSHTLDPIPLMLLTSQLGRVTNYIFCVCHHGTQTISPQIPHII